MIDNDNIALLPISRDIYQQNTRENEALQINMNLKTLIIIYDKTFQLYLSKIPVQFGLYLILEDKIQFLNGCFY